MSILWMVGAFALILTPIIFVHELGHFVVARFFNIEVEEFGLGFPPRAVKLFERNGTVYSLNWIPLGGFVRPAGEDDPSVPGGLAAATKTARFFTLSAGALANFVLAFIVFWFAFMIGPSAVMVEDVHANSPAMAAGLQSGDVILEINGQVVESSGILVSEVTEHAGDPVELLVQRGEEELSLSMVPRRAGEFDPEVDGPIGISLGYTSGSRLSRGPIESATASLRSIWDIMYLTVRAPIMLMEGQITAEQARPVGPVGISQIAGETARYTATTGDWFQLLRITAFISVALGFTNLLPIPALDGGRILFVLLEAVRGRRIEPEREGLVHLVGMLFLLGLMFLLIIQDIANPIIQ
ncbi:MAG TPA: RIP metalloprotease RseP [Candidatus Sulfomarinibacteraceae bacterium]|nr:RIP metalloprotease RseP [Candidatus Sulfomarinibacteraceae bacterium]